MRPRLYVPLVLAAVLGSPLAGCVTESGTDLITSAVSIEGGGFNDTGVDGFGDLDLPNLWSHKFGRAQEADDVRECRDQARCGVGGVVDDFGLLTGTSGKFAIVTTGNVECDPNLDDCCAPNPDPLAPCETHEIPVLVSGIETFPRSVDSDDGQTWTGAALLFDYSLLSGRASPAGAADSVIVRIAPAAGTPTTVLRLIADDLTGLPLRAGGCGTRALPDTGAGGVVTAYPTCSNWDERRVDITPFLGQDVSVQFIAGEAGAAIAIALDSVRFEVSR